MTFLFISFIAGALTVLAPCILPLLPVVIGSSASGRSKATPYIVVASLAVSIILFTFVLKVSTAFIAVPQSFWTYLSGGILFFFGLTLVFPVLWDRMPGLNKLSVGSNKLVGEGYQKKSVWGDVVIGAALGPVFSTCSPTYFVILASVLPASFLLGTVYLLSYTLGLSLVLLGVAILGERFSARLSSVADSHSWLKRGMGVLFVVLGLSIAFGYDKKLETVIVNSGFFDVTKIEQSLLQRTDDTSATTPGSVQNENQNAPDATMNAELSTSTATVSTSTTVLPLIEKQVPRDIRAEHPGTKYTEIVNPSGYVNTGDKPIRIGDYVGKKVILLDILTYSCINCQRTFPYANAWYEKYKDQGLIIIGIHTPEFAFEKDKQNVEDAMKRFGITFPIVLDNDYGTWNALNNRFWPHKYLIDIYGNVVYDHIGEGGYEETEQKIRELLAERGKELATSMPNATDPLAASRIQETEVSAQSPETYFGSARNEYLANGTPGASGVQNFTLPKSYLFNNLYLKGMWNMMPEYAVSSPGAGVVYKYSARDVYLVADSPNGADVEVWQDGVLVTDARGADVNENGVAHIGESRLYTIIHNAEAGQHTLELRVKKGSVQAYTFTFG